ncbi:MAG TPA: amidohydrolase family protein [Chitinophagaceae bacterium]|nr:amidohydrolase family protein [Chitinophagaceae bacterium]
MPITDTHIHCWNFDHAWYEWLKTDTSILKRTYNIDEIESERKEVGITQGILVQSANNFEDTDWMLEVAEKNDWITGVVGWLPLKELGLSENVLNEKYSLNKYFKGVRHLIHDEPDDKWLLQAEVIDSLKVLAAKDITYDVVGILPSHITTALEVANKIPGLKMVFDHLNQPPIFAKEKFGVWGELMREAAKHKNFYVKISGLGTTTKKRDWSSEDIKPYIKFVMQEFGEDRCMCGGDWPVSLLAGGYTKTWSIYKEVIDAMVSGEAREKVYHKNAVQFYNL